MIKNTQSAKLVDFNRKPQNTTCRWLFLFEQTNHTFKQRVGSTCLKLVFSPHLQLEELRKKWLLDRLLTYELYVPWHQVFSATTAFVFYVIFFGGLQHVCEATLPSFLVFQDSWLRLEFGKHIQWNASLLAPDSFSDEWSFTTATSLVRFFKRWIWQQRNLWFYVSATLLQILQLITRKQTL